MRTETTSSQSTLKETFPAFCRKAVRCFAVAMSMVAMQACVQIKPATFYTGEVKPEPVLTPDRISRVVEPVIFKDDKTDVWGLEKNDCQHAELSTDVAHHGRSSLKIVWDRDAPKCKWAGIGIGWEGYAGKDLTAIMSSAAISMYVRTVEGRMFSLPFVLTLEDYSGGMGFCYTANKYFERSAIDEEWQRVLVPLADFDLDTEKLDVSNIKQLQIELQQSGAVYLDNIELVFYTPETVQPWLDEEPLPNPTKLPIALFDDGFINNNGWGMMSDKCQNFFITRKEAAEGTHSIHAMWDRSSGDCELVSFGVSWARWHPVNVRPIMGRAAIQFQLKMVSSSSGADISVQVGFEDYDRQKSGVTLQNAYSATGTYTPTWTTVTVPLESLPANIDFTRVKHLYFEFLGSGECYIDDIRLVEMLP